MGKIHPHGGTMKPLRRIPLWSALASVLVTGLCLLHPALADIYAYTASDGTVNLSNVPADDRYEVVVPAPVIGPAPANTDEAPPTIAQKAHYDRIVDEV